MTREEAYNRIDAIIAKYEIDDEYVTITNFKDYDALRIAREILEQEPITIYEIPKDYKYDTETEDFLVYRHKYTGDEIHIERPVPLYRLEQEPCEDCISRKAALSDEGLSEFHYYEDYAKMRNYLKSLPPVTPQQRTGWIPVSERLPENHKDVLICLSSDEICIGCYNSHKLPFSNNAIGWGASYVHNWGSNDAIAWMPLPEPYKKEGD